MKPRVFVSSTYYHLKHVRDHLEKFIDNYGFESVLFESDKVIYEHGEKIDHSAYNEVKLCHLMVLIIGGSYGTPASEENLDQKRQIYEQEYVSITRREYETAVSKNIPIFVFIEKNAYSEYGTFKANQPFYEKAIKENSGFKFGHVDHPNVFKFIDIVKATPIKTFERVEEIENYLKSQLSGLFYLYLETLQRNKTEKKILDSVSELNNISQRMNEMLNEVGKKILEPGGDYQKVIQNQFKILSDYFAEKILSRVKFEPEELELPSEMYEQIASLLYEKGVLQSKVEDNVLKGQTKIREEINKELRRITNSKLSITDSYFLFAKFDFDKRILPLLDSSGKNKKILLNSLAEKIKFNLDPLF